MKMTQQCSKMAKVRRKNYLILLSISSSIIIPSFMESDWTILGGGWQPPPCFLNQKKS